MIFGKFVLKLVYFEYFLLFHVKLQQNKKDQFFFELEQKLCLFLQLEAEKKTLFLVRIKQSFLFYQSFSEDDLSKVVK
mgnify:CR=1 FL=1